MQLVLEVCDAGGVEPPTRKVFDGIGGVVGRGAGCDWIIPDPSRLLSSHHGLVGYRDGRYFLTDISSNGICQLSSGEALQKGQARLIVDGDVFQLGPFAVRARLNERTASYRQGLFAESRVIPDDAYLGLDPVHELDREQMHAVCSSELDALKDTADAPEAGMYRGSVEQDHLVIPTPADTFDDVIAPILPAVRSAPVDEAFWTQFAEALGVTLDVSGREALAIKAASLLRHAISGLQQNLHTHDELSNEWNLGIGASIKIPNGFKHSAGISAALASLLEMNEPEQCSAEAVIAQLHRQLQVHQVALLVACRTAMRTQQAAFAPGDLLLSFERHDKAPRFFSDRARWRAYQRHYQRLIDEETLSARPLHGDFAKAYEEQVRLASALFAGYPG